MKYCIIIVTAFLLIGCADKYPMGLNEQEYTQLSKQEKLQLRKEQARLDNKLKIEKEKTKQKQKEIEKIKQQKLEALYKSNDYRNVIVINLTDGSFQDHKLIPEAVILARGERKTATLKFRNKKGYTTTKELRLHYHRAGTKVSIKPQYYSDDAVVLLNTGRWLRGTYYTNKHLVYADENVISGLDIQIRYFD